MVLCSLTPKGAYEWMYDSPYVTLLASLTNDDEYVRLSQEHPECYRILFADKAWLEEESYTIDDLIDIAVMLTVDEIALPVDTIIDCLDYVRDMGLVDDFKWMGVCNSKSKKEFKKQFELLESLPEVSCIGIYAGTPNINNLTDIWMNTSKSIHYIGANKSLKTFIDMPAEQFYKIRSASTRSIFEYALAENTSLFDKVNKLPLNKLYKKLTRTKYDIVMREYQNYINLKGLNV